jgi:hypothetical protein
MDAPGIPTDLTIEVRHFHSTISTSISSTLLVKLRKSQQAQLRPVEKPDPMVKAPPVSTHTSAGAM